MSSKIRDTVIKELLSNKIPFLKDKFDNLMVNVVHKDKMENAGWTYRRKSKSWEKRYPTNGGGYEIASIDVA